MRLVRIAKVHWEVTAILDGRGHSVWTWLRDEGDAHHVERMRKRIKDVVPRNGPPRNRYQGTPLRDGIVEFRTGPEKGKKLRVLYFFDAGRRIVCTHGFWKTITAPEQIDKAVNLKKEYFRAKSRNALTVLGLEEIEKREERGR